MNPIGWKEIGRSFSARQSRLPPGQFILETQCPVEVVQARPLTAVLSWHGSGGMRIDGGKIGSGRGTA